MNLRRWIPVLLGPILLALAGCAGRSAAPEGAPPPPAIAAAEGALPDDPQGIELFQAANRGVIARADLARERATVDATRSLANRLVEEHRGFAARLGDLVSRLALVPEATAPSRELVAENDALLARLKMTTAEEFDAAWREEEAAALERLRQRLDAVLIPAARNDEYRAALLQIRPRVVQELEALRPRPAAATP